ncbi:MAG TPA: hypothetical protein VJW94_20135 [Candidatus Acidoferrum sp.]|nr:hypothetical protein [Candidatus Acidoferrum sp.]
MNRTCFALQSSGTGTEPSGLATLCPSADGAKHPAISSAAHHAKEATFRSMAVLKTFSANAPWRLSLNFQLDPELEVRFRAARPMGATIDSPAGLREMVVAFGVWRTSTVPTEAGKAQGIESFERGYGILEISVRD